MRPNVAAAALAVLMLVVVTSAQAPPPKPAPDPTVRDAIKRKLDETKARRDEMRRWREAPRPAPPPQPEPETPPSTDDDYLGDASELFETLLRGFGSPTVVYVHLKDQDEKHKDRKESLEMSDQLRQMLFNNEMRRQLEQLEKDLVQLEVEYVQAGGRLGLLQYAETKSENEVANRLNDEHTAEETKRLKDLENKSQNKPTSTKASPPPPPPPLSFRFDTPQWDVATTTYLAAPAFGVAASYQFEFGASISSTTASLFNAPVAPLDQWKDAVFRDLETLADVVLNPFIDRTPQDATLEWPRSSSNLVAMLRPSRLTVRAELQQPFLPQPSAKVFFTNLGGSTGETVRMTIVNDGNVPVRFDSDGFALVPIANVTSADVERELQRLARFPQQTVTVRAYCRDIGKAVPQAETVMRLADASVQAQMTPFRRVLEASRRLLDAGVLKPDVDDRELYLDSVRQWARWTMAERFNERSFITAFIEHTKKNTIAAGQKWERSFDSEARQIATERWRDVQRVLTEAQSAR